VSAARGDALIRELERRFVVVTDRVYFGATSFDVLHPRSAEELISGEGFAVDERLPYWADIWPSSIILAGRLLEERGAGRQLLELGCGLGLATMAAMRAGFQVLATDYYEDALRFTRANAWRAFGREPQTRLVDWRALPDDLDRFDRVVAADVLYERPYAQFVAQAIARTLAPTGEATVADPGRIAAGEFVRQCEASGLTAGAAEVRPFVSGTVRQRITLYAARRA
jgi:predicted nicotinamide N-methyase